MNANADDYARMREARRKKIEEETKGFENELKRREAEREKRRQEQKKNLENSGELAKRLAEEEERKKKLEEDQKKRLTAIQEETKKREERLRLEEEERKKEKEKALVIDREKKEKAEKEAEAQKLERAKQREARQKAVEAENARKEEERKQKLEEQARLAEARRKENLQQLGALKKRDSLRQLVRSETAKKIGSPRPEHVATADAPSATETPAPAPAPAAAALAPVAAAPPAPDAQAERLKKLEEQAALEVKAELARKKEAERIAREEIERLEKERAAAAEAAAVAKKKAEEEAAKREKELSEKKEADAKKVALSAMTYEQRFSLTRKNPDVPIPAVNRLDIAHTFVLDNEENPTGDKKPDHDLLKTHFLAEGRVDVACALKIVETATAILKTEPNCLKLKAPCLVVGDIHGQFFDLCKLLDRSGAIAYNQFLFLGDYVDRGNFSMEVILYLLACKICFPKQCFLLRGNHETRNLTQYFNFKSECLYKYSQAVYDALMIAFEALPIAALLEGTEIGKYLAMHGGIGPDIKTVEDLNTKIDRFAEPLDYGAFCDVLWSDPFDGDEWCAGWTDQALFAVEFRDNHSRGCGQFYGYAAVTRFLQRNDIKGIIRAHEVKKFGYEEHTFRASDPLVITVFSAPNYCESYENFSAYMRFTDERYTLEQCEFTPQPFYLPNFANVFNYSLPYIFEAVSKFSLSFLQLCEEQDDEAELIVDEKTVEAARSLATNRMKSVGRTLIAMQKQREENESLLSQSLSFKDAADVFRAARQADAKNERKPPSWQTFRSTLQAGSIFGRILDAKRGGSLTNVTRPQSPGASATPFK